VVPFRSKSPIGTFLILLAALTRSIEVPGSGRCYEKFGREDQPDNGNRLLLGTTTVLCVPSIVKKWPSIWSLSLLRRDLSPSRSGRRNRAREPSRR